MSRLVLSEVDGSPSQELQDLSLGVWCDVIEGDLWSFPVVRGGNLIIGGLAGQTPMTTVEHELAVKLAMRVWGDGATGAMRRAAHRTRMAAINAILGRSGKVVRLVAHPPNLGLAPGETATIDVQFVRASGIGDPMGWEMRLYELDLRCIEDPPVWVVA